MTHSKRPRLTIVCENYWPEVASTAQLVTALAEDLSVSFDVEVIATQPRYHGDYSRRPVRETRNGVSIRRVSSTGFNKSSKIGRVCNWLTFLLSAGTVMATAWRRRTYLLVTNPPTAPWLSLLARLQRQRSYVVVFDLYPDLAQTLKVVRGESGIVRTFDRINLAAFRAADAVVALGADMASRLREKLGDATRVEIIPNFADADLISPRPKAWSDFARRHGLMESIVFLYAGNLGLFQDLETLIDAVERLEDDSTRLVFVGDGGKRELVEAAARRSQRVLHFDYVPYEQLGDLYAAADVGLIAIEPGVERVNMPSKTYSILAAGRPFIAVAAASSDLRELAGEGAGIVVDNEAIEVAEAMATLSADPDLRRSMGRRARSLFDQRYTRRRITGLYAALLSDPIAEGSRSSTTQNVEVNA